MHVKILKTYRGNHGLFVQGHIYDLTQGQVAAIQEELGKKKRTFEFEKVKDANNFNRPAKKAASTPANKQLAGGKTK